MEPEKVLLIAGEPALEQAVLACLAERGIETVVVRPDGATEDALFDAAYDNSVTSVVLIEPLARLGPHADPPEDDLIRGAMRAARAPLVKGLGWVTSRPDVEALSDFRLFGKPYGVLRSPVLLEVAVDDSADAGPVLVDADAVSKAEHAGACAIGDAAEAIASWIEHEGMRGGSHESIPAGSNTVERTVRELGFAPKTVARWRIGLNRAFGVAVLDTEATPWRIRRKRFFRGLSSSPAAKPIDIRAPA